MKFKLLRENVFEKSLKIPTATCSKTLVRRWRRFIESEGGCVGKLNLETNYTFCAISFVLFHFDTLHGSKDRDVDALLSEQISHNDLVDNAFIRYSQNIPWEISVTLVTWLHAERLRTLGSLSLTRAKDFSRVFTSSGPTQTPIQKVVVGSSPRK